MAILVTLPSKEANHGKGYGDLLITPDGFIMYHLTHVGKNYHGFSRAFLYVVRPELPCTQFPKQQYGDNCLSQSDARRHAFCDMETVSGTRDTSA